MAARRSVVVASAWMVGVTLVLFFLPAVNGLIGGAVGGYKAGSIGRALTAALLPAVVVGVGLFLLLTLLDAAGWGLLFGLTAGILIALCEVSLFVGAILGGFAGARADGRRVLA